MPAAIQQQIGSPIVEPTTELQFHRQRRSAERLMTWLTRTARFYGLPRSEIRRACAVNQSYSRKSAAVSQTGHEFRRVKVIVRTRHEARNAGSKERVSGDKWGAKLRDLSCNHFCVCQWTIGDLSHCRKVDVLAKRRGIR